MKLYATITSERASKGQGGNKNLWIKLVVEHDNKEREVFAELNLCREEDYFILTEFNETATSEIKSIKVKGKKQKGECEHQNSKLLQGLKWQCNECDAIWFADK